MRALRATVLTLVVVLLLAAGGVITFFLLRNSQWVVVQIPILTLRLDDPVSSVEYESPLAVVVGVAFVVGCFVATLLFLPSVLRRTVERSRERRFIRSLEGELGDLRSLPVEAPAPLEDLASEEEGVSSTEGRLEEDERALLEAAVSGGGRGPRPKTQASGSSSPKVPSREEEGEGGERPR